VWRDAGRLCRHRYFHSCGILVNIAKEEAAKAMMLVDAERCLRGRLREHLKAAGSHLSRLIYEDYYDWHVDTFAEIRNAVDDERDKYYVDGPDGGEGVLKNLTEGMRERELYVDFYWDEGACYWRVPEEESGLWASRGVAPTVLAAGTALYHCGMTSPAALRTIAQRWRSIQIRDEMGLFWHCRLLNTETVCDLRGAGLIRRQGDALQFVEEQWRFPLSELELSPRGNLDACKKRARELRSRPAEEGS
jgi:hypothetical protein